MTLIQLLLEQAQQHPARIALIEATGRTLSFAELVVQSEQMAAFLQAKNIQKGDAVLVAVLPGIDLYVTLAALWRLGAKAVFPEAAMGLKGVIHAAKTIRPKALIAGKLLRAIRFFHPALFNIPQVIDPSQRAKNRFCGNVSQSGDAALISFTSGTTGQPKAMQRSHALLLSQHHALVPVLKASRPNGEIDLIAFPALALSVMGQGNTALLPNWPMRRHDKVESTKIMAWANAHQASRLIVPPIILSNIANTLSQSDFSPSLHRLITGGAPFFPDEIAQCQMVFPNLGLTILYGSTEAEPISHLECETISKSDWQNMYGSAGLLVGHVVFEATLHFDEKGQIWVAGPHVNESYLDPKHNSENKQMIDGRIYHCTGDIGRLGSDGRLWLLGRAKTTQNELYPIVVEIQARQQKGVKAAALLLIDEQPVLALSGQHIVLDVAFQKRLEKHGVRIVMVDALPLDQRHRSKVDYKKLTAMIKKNAKF